VVRAAKYAQAPAAPSSAVAPEVHALSVCRQLAALCSIFVAMRGAPLHECKRARAHHRGWDRHWRCRELTGSSALSPAVLALATSMMGTSLCHHARVAVVLSCLLLLATLSPDGSNPCNRLWLALPCLYGCSLSSSCYHTLQCRTVVHLF